MSDLNPEQKDRREFEQCVREHGIYNLDTGKFFLLHPNQVFPDYKTVPKYRKMTRKEKRMASREQLKIVKFKMARNEAKRIEEERHKSGRGEEI
jgi:hypothetical protein